MEGQPVALFRSGKKPKYAFKPTTASFQPERNFQPVTITYELDPASKAALTAKPKPKRPRKTDDHGAAFVFGFVVAGVASAAAVLWKLPRSGAQTRELIADRTEATLFNLMGMDDYLTGEKTPTAVTGSFGAAGEPESPLARGQNGSSLADRTPHHVGAAPSPFDDTEPFATVEDDGGSLPPTFRGEPLNETPSASAIPADVSVETPHQGSNNR
jgi:hypothetical protein